MEVAERLQGAVSAASDADARLLTAISSLGVHIRDLRLEVDPVRALRECRFLIADLGTRTSASVLLDLGSAVALRKPILVIAPSIDAVPLALADRPIIASRNLGLEDLQLQLEAFVQPLRPPAQRVRLAKNSFDEIFEVAASPSVREHRGPQPVAKRPSGSAKQTKLLPSRESFRGEAEFEVASLFAVSGASVVPQELGPHGREVPDLAVSFEALGPGFVPVLVEIAGLRASIDSKVEILDQALRSRGLQLGIVVSLDAMHSPSDVPTGNVLVLTLDTLRELSHDSKLIETLRRARNWIVHVGG